jgi:hypothetical protein
MATTVVNMTPNALSGEANQDSEPMIAVNLANPQQIAGSAFTPDPANGPNAPIYVSTDGGSTWALNTIVPSNPATGDICMRFGTQGNRLYIGILQQPFGLRMNILRTNNFTAAAAATRLVDRGPGPNLDQPFVQVGTLMQGAGTDRVYVGNNDFATPPNTATVDVSLDGAAAAPPPPANFNARRLDTRATTVNQDSPHIRPAVHLDGTVYAIYAARTAVSGTIRTCNIVVVRDNNWASGATPFNNLLDSGDGQRGQIVVSGVNVVWNTAAAFGQERLGGNVAIAVDPRDSRNVYAAWADNAGSLSTLHVRRSQDSGQNWSGADLRVITGAINPALAINSRGRVCFMYQQLTGTAPNQRWETHIELTDNDWATVNNRILSNTPASAPARVFGPYLGDYIGLMAAGKDFYGAFCANNTPNTANFPQGVTFQRNVNTMTQTLLANDGVTAVPVSIDPFFVKETLLSPNADVYVRDWTDSPTSGDNGLEPSTNPWFYVNPDVWNRNTNAPGAFDANDRPVNEVPIPGAAPAGQNFAFARIRRNASGAAATVTAKFLVSPFGTGSSYVAAGAAAGTAVSFSAADLVQTSPGHQWHLAPTTSIHLCLAVEISTPADPAVTPGLLGRTPGWPTTDLMVINDNNKAQRNMGVGETSEGGSSTFYALVHNAAYELRDVVLRFSASDAARKHRVSFTLGSIGGKRARAKGPEGELVLRDMQPGEDRWVAVDFRVSGAATEEPLPIFFSEMEGNSVRSGFAVAPHALAPSELIRRALRGHRSVFLRMTAAFGVAGGAEESDRAAKLDAKERVTEKAYAAWVARGADSIPAAVKELLAGAEIRDRFAVNEAMGQLATGPAAHITLLNKLDAFMTLAQKVHGEPADVLQNVEWQRAMIKRQPRLRDLSQAAALLKRSQRFVTAFEAAQVTPDDFPTFLKETFEEMTEMARAAGGLDDALERIRAGLGSSAATQKAHRDFLIELETALA